MITGTRSRNRPNSAGDIGRSTETPVQILSNLHLTCEGSRRSTGVVDSCEVFDGRSHLYHRTESEGLCRWTVAHESLPETEDFSQRKDQRPRGPGEPYPQLGNVVYRSRKRRDRPSWSPFSVDERKRGRERVRPVSGNTFNPGVQVPSGTNVDVLLTLTTSRGLWTDVEKTLVGSTVVTRSLSVDPPGCGGT